MKTDPTFWILARASGMTAYVLLTASVLAGLVLKTRPFRSLKPAQVADTHRFLSMLGLGALALHGMTIALDRAVTIPLIALVVPGASPYRPLAVGIGVLAAELMAVVYASFSQRKRIGAKNWRRLHYATYAVFGLATAHGLFSGTDTGRPWALAVYFAAVGAGATATAFRVLSPKPSPQPMKAVAARVETPAEAPVVDRATGRATARAATATASASN